MGWGYSERIMRELMGAILAGGRSIRMGRDKATLPLRDGRTMLECVAEALRAACGIEAGEIAIVVSSPGRALDPRHAGGYVEVADLREHVGPLGGIEALLASNLAREYLVCPCDVPRITPEALRLLLQRRDAPATVLRVASGDLTGFEPLPARISVVALPAVRKLLDSGERSVWKLMEDLPAAIVDINATHAAALRNVNTPDDLNTV